MTGVIAILIATILFVVAAVLVLIAKVVSDDVIQAMTLIALAFFAYGHAGK